MESQVHAPEPLALHGDKELTLPKEHQEEIILTSFKEFMSLKKGESIEDDSKIRDIDHELDQINPEASQFSRMLLIPDVQETAEHLILPPLQEKPMELISAQEGSEIENIVVPAKEKDKNPMKSTELQAETENLPPIEDREGKRPQDLSYGYGEESGNEGMSSEDPHIKTEKQDPQQISEEISESRIVNCTEEEVAEKSQAVLEEVNDSEEIIINNPTEGYVTPFMEETLTDSSSIKECSKKMETEIYESETITSDSGVYVDQLAEPTSTEATKKTCHAGLAAETIPADTLANDELQYCQIRARENATISKMVKQNDSFHESDLLEENVLQETEISAESISYDHDNKRNGFKTEESGCSFEGENVAREPYSSDQTSSTTKSSVPCLNYAIGNESASSGIDDISSFSDSENKERVDTEATVNMMQELENKRGRVPTETTLDDNPEEIIDDSCMVSEKQLDSLTIEGITFTDETGLMVDRKQKIPLLEEEDQVKKSNNVTEKAYMAIGKKNTIEDENGSVCTPDKDTEDVSEFNYEEIQNDSEPGEHCGNDPDIVKHFDIVNQETEGTTSDHRGQNHENIGNEELHSIRALMSPGEDPEPLGVMGKIEDCPNSEEGENNATSESNVNVNEETSIDVDKQCAKSDDDLTPEEHNENQPLSVTCPESGAKDHDTINKVEDSDDVFQFLKTGDFSGVQEVRELQYTEETGINKDEQEDENVYNVTGGTATELPEIENARSKEIHPGSREIDQEIIKESRPYSDADNPIDTSQDEGTGESSEPIEDNSSDKLQHTAKSAVGGENNTTIAEVENYGSSDERKVVDYTAAEKDQEAHSENKDLTTKDADFVTEADNVSGCNLIISGLARRTKLLFELSFCNCSILTQVTKVLEYNKSIEKEVAQKDLEVTQEIDFNPAQLNVRSGTGSDNPDAQNDREEVQEHDEQKSETLVDKSNEHEVIYANASSSGNEIDTGSSEIKHDETLSLAEQMTEAPPGKSQISIDAVSPELSVNEQSMKSIIREASMQEVPQRSNSINAFVVNSIEVSQHKDAMEGIQHEISQGFEQDVMSSEMTCQKISPAIDSLRQNIGTSMNEPTQNEPSETVNDKGHIVELSKDAGFETEQHNQTNNKAAYEIGSSAEENVEAASSQSITISAVGGEINTTAADNDGGAYQSKVVDCTDGKSAEKVQEAYSDNQHSTNNKVEFVIDAEASVNKAQNFDQEINSNLVQYNESNGAPTEGLDVQNDGEEEKDVRNRTAGTATVNDTEIVNQRTTESHPGIENLNQEITIESIPYLDADESLTDNDEGTRMSSEAAQIIEQDGSAADKQHNLEFEGSAIINHGATPKEVIYANTSSSENGMETTNSEVKHAVPGLEHNVHEQSTQGEAEQEAELDTNTPEATAKKTATVVKETSLQEALEQNNSMKPVVVNSIEEIQYINNKEGVSLMLDDPNHLDSQDDEINKQPKITQSGNATLTAIKLNQYVQDRGLSEAKEEDVSNVTTNCISDQNVDEMTPNETVQTQGNQAVETLEFRWPLSFASKATSTNEDIEESSMTLKDLNNKKEDLSQETTKQNPCISEEIQRELQASTGFELRGDLPVVEEVSKTEEYLVPETPGTNDSIDGEKMEPRSYTEGFSQKIECEADQVQQMVKVSLTTYARIRPVSENFEQTCEETTNNQETAKSSEQVIELNNKEQTLEDTIKDRDDDRVKGELIVEKSTADESYKSHGTSANDTSKEEQEKCIKTEVGTMGDEIQSINVEELKGRDANEARGSEGNTVRSKEMVFHEHGKINLSDRDQGIGTDVDVEAESSDPTKDNFTWISADEMQVSEEKRREAIDKHHNNPLDGEAESLNPIGDNFTRISADEIQVAEVPKAEAIDKHHTNPQIERTSNTLNAGTSEEVPSGYVEMVKSSSEPVVFKESKRFEKEIMEEKEEANADAEGREPKFYEIGNDAEREEKLLNKTECNSKTDDCSISISRDEKEYSKDVESKSLEGEDVPGTYQQATSEERTDNEVSIMELKMDATEISHEINAPEPDTMEIEKKKLQEWAKVLDFSSVQEPQQRNDGLWFTDMPGNMAAAESIGIVELQGDFSYSRNPFMSTDNPAELICAPEVKQSEIEHPSLEQNQEVEDKLRTADSVRADNKELTSVFQGVDSNAETKSHTDDSTLSLMNVKEDQDLIEKRKTEKSRQLNLSSQTGSRENKGNSSSVSNDNHTKTEDFKQVNEFQREKLATSEEIGKDTHRQSVKNYLIGERSPSNFEVYETATTDAREETNHNVEVSAFGIKETQPIEPNPSAEKISEQPPAENVSNQDGHNTQTVQVDKEVQLHGNYDDIHHASQFQEKEPVDTVDIIYSGQVVHNFTDETPEKQNQTGGSLITDSNTNEVPTFTPIEFVTTSHKEINAEECKEHIVVPENPPAAEKPMTEKKKQDKGNDLREEDSEPKPVISETSRDTELKMQHKKSQFILSGMGSKMKHSISKVKKAMTCTSPQFPTDNVIVKLNKSKKS